MSKSKPTPKVLLSEATTKQIGEEIHRRSLAQNTASLVSVEIAENSNTNNHFTGITGNLGQVVNLISEIISQLKGQVTAMDALNIAQFIWEILVPPQPKKKKSNIIQL